MFKSVPRDSPAGGNNTQRGGHNEGQGAVPLSITVLMSSFLLHKNNSEVGSVMIERELRSTLTKDSLP